MKGLKIICGTDFSDLAKRASSAAAVLCARSGDTLVLVHVHEKNDPVTKGRFPKLETAVRARLHWEAGRLRKLGATVDEKFLIGSPCQLLVETARKPGVRLMIVGATGHTLTQRWQLGSVAERTAERSPVPTLVLRDPAKLEKWASGKKPLKVFVAADFSASSDAALHWVAELASIGKCKVTVGHVDWPPESSLRLGVKGPLSFQDNPDEVQRVLERDLREKTERALGNQQVAIRIEPGWGRPDVHLVNLAQLEKADLIVVGTRQGDGAARLPFGSVSRSILHHAPMSVAVVPTRKLAESDLPVPEIRRVLVATDFSKLGNSAIAHAYAPVAAGGIVHLIHVMPPREPSNPIVAPYQKQVVTKAAHLNRLKAIRKKLVTLIPKKAAHQIKTEIEVVEDTDAARAIYKTAERAGADLICMGSHGRSGLSKAILGSVAASVMTKSKRPILIIRPTKE